MPSLRYLTAVIMVCLLTACATTAPSTPPLAMSELILDHGFVLVRIATNVGIIDSGTSNQWQQVFVADTAGNEFALGADKFGGRTNSQVFGSFMRPGRYHFTRMVSTPFDGTFEASLQEVGGSFEIKAGQVTTIGTLIYQPIGDHRYTILRDLRDDDLQRLLQVAYTEVARESAGKPILRLVDGEQINDSEQKMVLNDRTPWQPGVAGSPVASVVRMIARNSTHTPPKKAWAETQDIQVRLRMARASSYAFHRPQDLITGEVIAGSNLGQMLVRERNGTWSHIGTDDVRDITAFDAKTRDDILAGGEEGLLRLTQDGGKTWIDLKAPSLGLTLGVNRYEGYCLLLMLEGLDVVVYRSDDLRKGEWTELKRELKVESRFPTITPPLSLASAVLQQDRYMVMAYTGVYHVLDLRGDSWTSGKAPFPEPLVRQSYSLGALPTGFIYAMGGRTAYSTNDFGKTWKEQGAGCLRLLGVRFGDDGAGYSLCFQGAMVASSSIQKKDYGAADWHELVAETPRYARTFYAGARNHLLLYIDDEGAIEVSKDGGKHWKLERSAD